jgi:hypothetical protein
VTDHVADLGRVALPASVDLPIREGRDVEGPVALVKSEIVTLTVPDEPLRFVFFVFVVPFTLIWNVISDGPCGKSFSSTDAVLQSTSGGPLAT